jgi:hypothetical protein
MLYQDRKCLVADIMRESQSKGILPSEDNSWKVAPVQTVDATPSSELIRQCFPERSDLFGCARSNPSQGSVPADLTPASDSAFVFNIS